MRRWSGATGRALATFLAITAAVPAVQWCRYTWAEIPLECMVGFAGAANVRGCPADLPSHAAAAGLVARATECDGASACPFAHAAGGCPRAEESGCSAKAGTSASELPSADHGGRGRAHSGRAWCPQNRSGAPTVSDASRLHPHDVAAILPEPAVTRESLEPH